MFKVYEASRDEFLRIVWRMTLLPKQKYRSHRQTFPTFSPYLIRLPVDNNTIYSPLRHILHVI